MANALGYQKREEGEGAFDIGGAARTQAGAMPDSVLDGMS